MSRPEEGWSIEVTPPRRAASRRGFLTQVAGAGLAVGLGPLLDACSGDRDAVRAADHKAPRRHDVRSYGADPTGAKDSAKPIQAALNAARAAGGGVVHLPAGLYVVSQILQIGSGTALLGDGRGVSTIKAADGFSPHPVDGLFGLSILVVANNAGASNIVLSDLTFDGNQANITHFQAPFDESDSHCLYLCYIDGLQIRNIEIINAIRYSLFLMQCSHSSVKSSHIISGQEPVGSRTQQDGIHLTGCTHCVIAGNNVDTGTTEGVGDDAISLQALTSGHPVTNIMVASNVLRSGTRGVALVPYRDSINKVIIIRNDIRETQDDGIIFNVTGPGPACSDITIRDNRLARIATSGRGHGINLQSVTTAGYQDVVISGNLFTGFMNRTGFGIYAGQGKNLTVDGNNFDDFRGIRVINIGDVGAPVNTFRVLDNRLDASAGPRGNVGIMVLGSRDGAVSGNTINGNASASSYGVELLGTKVAVTGVAVQANQISDWANGIAESGSGARPDYNTVTGNLLIGCRSGIVTRGAHDVVAGNSASPFA
jgi:polygalacturonase